MRPIDIPPQTINTCPVVNPLFASTLLQPPPSSPQTQIDLSAIVDSITCPITGDIMVDPVQGNLVKEIVRPVNGFLFTLRELPVSYEGAVLARIAC